MCSYYSVSVFWLGRSLLLQSNCCYSSKIFLVLMFPLGENPPNLSSDRGTQFTEIVKELSRSLSHISFAALSPLVLREN